ncbi:MAG TPA: hypothetical protein VK324_16885, partial [Tepidisphaeraceae bacterium]|nr:hypothetical protein [Tepidisphaeraceae bacterium]
MSNRTSVTARKYRPVQALLIAATVAVAPAVAAAQYRVGNDGRALDANNRVGSGGYNTGGRTGPAVTPNDIVYGNVTAGKEFRGPVGSTDAGAFRGSTAGRVSDDFIRESAGVPLPGQPNANTNAQVARPFYGQGRAAPPPAGTVQQGFSGAYVAPLDTRAPMRSPADLRLGTVVDSPQVLPPSLGDLAVAGAPLDPSAGNTLITASPLYGVRQWSADNTTDRAVMDRFGGQGGANPLSRLDEQSLRRLRGELERSSAEGGAEQQTQPGGAIASPNLSNPQESPADARLNDRVTSPDLLSPTNDGGVVSGQSYRNRLLIAPEKQSALYAELSRRFEAEGKPVSDE